MRLTIEEKLQSKLGTEFGIGKLRFNPFNSLELDSVYLYDLSGEKIFVADKIFAQVDILPLFQKKLIFNTAQINNFDIKLSKDSSNTPLNIQFIIDAFKSDNQKSSSPLQIKLSAVSMSNGNFTYDVKEKPRTQQFDVNHISVSNLNARLALKSLVYDSLNVQIKKLSLKEKSGFEIKNLTTRIVTQNQKASVRGFRLDLPNSFLQFDKCDVDLSEVHSTNDLLDNATFDCVITPSYIAPKDVAAFSPSLQYFTDLITIQGRITGAIDDIAISNLKFNYGERMHLLSNFEIKDIRYPNKTYILGSIDEFFMTGMELENLLSNFQKENVTLPPTLKNFKSITFEGAISGYINQLTAFGTLDTDAGIIKTEILFGKNPDKKTATYLQGKLYASDFNIQKITGGKDIGNISLELAIKMRQPQGGKFMGNAKAQIYKLEYKGYTYTDAVINAQYDKQRLDGSLNIKDENGVVDLKGLFDFSDKKNPEFNFMAHIEDVKLDNLHLSEKMKYSNLSFNIHANLKGTNIDDLQGYISLDSLDFIRENQRFYMDRFLVEASGTSSDRKLTIKSDILSADVTGAYSLTTIPQSIQRTMSQYIPAIVNGMNNKGSKKIEMGNNNVMFSLQINNTEELSKILNLPVSIVNQAKLTGYYNNNTDKFKLEVFTPYIKVAGTNIKSGYIIAENSGDKIKNEISAVIVGKNNMMNKIDVSSDVGENLINTKIEFANEVKNAKGKFNLSTLFTHDQKSNHLNVDVDIQPSSLILNGALWNAQKAHFSLRKNWYNVDNFTAGTADGSQRININGTYAPHETNALLKTELKNIDLGYIFEILAIDVLKFGGKATGNVFVSSIDGNPYANTHLNIDDFQFNGTHLGNLSLFSEFDDETRKVMMNGEITSTQNKKTQVNGSIDPIGQELSLNFNADSLDISFLNTYAANIFNDIKGYGSGKVHLFGDFSNVTVEGDAYIYDGSLGINFLNTRYNFTDSIHMKSNLIYFNDITFTDQYNNKAVGSGKVAHNRFSDISYYVELAAQNFLLYNVSEKQNPVFSGKVFGSGKAAISGDERSVDIDVRMRTEDNTAVRMNFMDDVVSEYNFITYKSKKFPEKAEESTSGSGAEIAQPIQTNSEMDINMNFYIDATPVAVAEIVMDPVGGDVLKGSGSGALQFTWSTKSAPRLYGNYLINRGSYLFTFQRILDRKFIIEDGSSVHFDGDPFQANLNVEAIYKVTANLNDLSSSLVESSGQTNIPVNCLLKLTGPLRHPNVGLDLAFPNAIPEVQRQIKVFLNSEDIINKQVAYLLLMSKFYTPGNSDTEYKTSDFAVFASATLSNQLTKIISKIDRRWQLGTNIRTSDSEMTNTEIELLLSSQLLNDRLLINGNFGYRDDPKIARDAFIGDVDVEYLLNPSGTWRVKAYNRYNKKFYYTGTAEQTQGVGIKYKKDFDKPVELLPWYKKKKKVVPTIQDSIVPIIPDSIEKGSKISSFIKLKK